MRLFLDCVAEKGYAEIAIALIEARAHVDGLGAWGGLLRPRRASRRIPSTCVCPEVRETQLPQVPNSVPILYRFDPATCDLSELAEFDVEGLRDAVMSRFDTCLQALRLRSPETPSRDAPPGARISSGAQAAPEHGSGPSSQQH